MKKKALLLALSVILTLNLSACAVGSTGLSEAELKQVAEYAAKLILKHTRNYEPSLQEELEIKQNPDVVKEDFNMANQNGDANMTSPSSVEGASPSSVEGTSPSSIEENSVDGADDASDASSPSGINGLSNEGDTAENLSDIYGEKDFEIVYGGAGEYERYPKNEGYFSLVATDNMKLYVVEFSIINKTQKDKKFMQGDGVTYSLTFDGDNFYKPSLTLLENDMQSIETTVAGGKTSKGVIVFNVPKKADRNRAKLRVTNGGKVYTINVTR